MNRHYAMEQARPKSLTQLFWMIRRGWIGYYNGLMQRLFTRDPALALLALAGLFTPLMEPPKARGNFAYSLPVDGGGDSVDKRQQVRPDALLPGFLARALRPRSNDALASPVS